MQYAVYAGSYIGVSFQPNQFYRSKKVNTDLTAFYS
jgi:hypothetical protein